MTRQELIDQLALKNGLTKKNAKLAVETIFKTMSESLAAGGRIEIRGFGSFKIKSYGGFTGRNPKTGEKVKVKPKKLPSFRASKSLKQNVDRD